MTGDDDAGNPEVSDASRVLVAGDISNIMDVEPSIPATPSPTVSAQLSSPRKRTLSKSSMYSEETIKLERSSPAPVNFIAEVPDISSVEAMAEVLSPSTVAIPESPIGEAKLMVKQESVTLEDTLSVGGIQDEMEELPESIALIKSPIDTSSAKTEVTESAAASDLFKNANPLENLGNYRFRGVPLSDCDVDFTGNPLSTAEQLSYAKPAYYKPLTKASDDADDDAGYTDATKAVLDHGLDPTVIPKLLELKRAIERKNAIERESQLLDKQLLAAKKRLESAQHAYTLSKTKLHD